jgi:hypothetical protein
MQTVEAEPAAEAQAVWTSDYERGWSEGYDKGYRDAVAAAFWNYVTKDK